MLSLLIYSNAARAEDIPFLERTITVTCNQERLEVALKKISQQGGFTFSYNSAIVDANKIVSYTFTNKTIREILDQLFNGTIQYKVRGKYVILTKAEISSVKTPQIYSGYVLDEATGERLKNVSVYDPVTLSSTITDSYGYFEIEIEKPSADLRLAINKQSYTDTLIVVPSKTGRLLNIPLHIDKHKFTSLADSVGQRFKRFWKKTQVSTSRVNLANIDDTLYRTVQFSLIPFVGTNHALSGNVINDYSLNLLGGYSLGVKKIELGGMFNIVSGNVNSAQLAGVFNAVGGDVTGVQMAGIFNANRGSVQGAQFAGVFNLNWNGVKYFAAAGMINLTRHGSQAVQAAGIGNVTIGKQESPHLAGLFNFSTDDVKSQIAGCYNFTAHNVKGWQVAGVVNFAAKKVEGAQTAGILNFAGKEVRGIQLAGVLNYATKVHGTQIGLVNVADSIKGVPVGFLSFVMKGYHKIEISADEMFYTNVAFRTGVHQFYNIFTAGAKPSTFKNDATFWTFGYGVGTAPRLSKKLSLNFDITSNQITQGHAIEAVNMINKVYVGIDYTIVKKVSITAGATLNGYVTDNTYNQYQDVFADYHPNIFYNQNFGNDLNMKMWIGGKVGLRFL
jgi:hypothetical protein